jgi:hypothetical protein
LPPGFDSKKIPPGEWVNRDFDNGPQVRFGEVTWTCCRRPAPMKRAPRATVLCRYGRSGLRESAACSRDSVQLSAQKRAREGIESDPILHPMHGTASRTNASDHASLLGQARVFSRTVSPHARLLVPLHRHPSVCLPDRRIGTVFRPKFRLQPPKDRWFFWAHSGTGTVRMWPPLPTRSTIAQCSSRCCKCVKSRSANSRRRSPQPSNTARIAPSRFPLSVFGPGDCQKRRASSAVSQFPASHPTSWHL